MTVHLRAQLYMRDGCHLCELAEAELRRLAAAEAGGRDSADPPSGGIARLRRVASRLRLPMRARGTATGVSGGADLGIPSAASTPDLGVSAVDEGVELSLELIDIDQLADVALRDQYAERIPVLVIGGCEYAAPLPRELLARALRDAIAAAIDGTRASSPPRVCSSDAASTNAAGIHAVSAPAPLPAPPNANPPQSADPIAQQPRAAPPPQSPHKKATRRAVP